MLPFEGYRGAVPAFPLAEPTDLERELWRELWRKPQAVMWVRLGLRLQVAAYVRAFTESTVTRAPASLKVSVLRMEDTLGMSPAGLLGLRWRIADAPEQAAEEPRGSGAPVRRLRAVGAVVAADEGVAGG